METTTNANISSRPSSLRQPGSRASSTRKQPSYDASALTINASPQLTSSLHSRNSASSAQESSYLARAHMLHISRLVLAGLTCVTAIAAVGTISHVLRSYNGTHLGRQWFLPLWPVNVNVTPTLAVLVSGCIVAALSLCVMVFSLIPTPHSRAVLHNTLFAASAGASLLLSLLAVIFHHTRDTANRETLSSYTCKFTNGAASFNSAMADLRIPAMGVVPVPAGFTRLCAETEASVGLLCGVLGLSVVGCAVAAVGVWNERQIGGLRRKRYGEKWEVSARMEAEAAAAAAQDSKS